MSSLKIYLKEKEITFKPSGEIIFIKDNHSNDFLKKDLFSIIKKESKKDVLHIKTFINLMDDDDVLKNIITILGAKNKNFSE